MKKILYLISILSAANTSSALELKEYTYNNWAFKAPAMTTHEEINALGKLEIEFTLGKNDIKVYVEELKCDYKLEDSFGNTFAINSFTDQIGPYNVLTGTISPNYSEKIYQNFLVMRYMIPTNKCLGIGIFYSDERALPEPLIYNDNDISKLIRIIRESVWHVDFKSIDFRVIESSLEIQVVKQVVYLDPQKEDNLNPKEATERTIWAYRCGYITKSQFEDAALANEFVYKAVPKYPIFFDKDNFEEVWAAPVDRNSDCVESEVSKYRYIYFFQNS